MTIDTEPEVHEIEHGRRPGDGAEHGRIASGRRIEIRLFDRHRVNLLGAQRHVGEQAFVQLREIARGITRRRHALVDLEDVHAFPRHGHVRKNPQHHPGRAAAADREVEASTLGDAAASLGRDDFGRRVRHGLAVCMDLSLHLRSIAHDGESQRR